MNICSYNLLSNCRQFLTAMHTIADWKREQFCSSNSTNSYPTGQAFPMSLAASYHDFFFGFWQRPEIWLSAFPCDPALQKHLITLRSILSIADSSSSILDRLHQYDNRFAPPEEAIYSEKCDPHYLPSITPIYAAFDIRPDPPREIPQAWPASYPPSSDTIHISAASSSTDVAMSESNPFDENIKEIHVKKPKRCRKRSKYQKRYYTDSSGSDADDEGPIFVPKRRRMITGKFI